MMLLSPLEKIVGAIHWISLTTLMYFIELLFYFCKLTSIGLRVQKYFFSVFLSLLLILLIHWKWFTNFLYLFIFIWYFSTQISKLLKWLRQRKIWAMEFEEVLYPITWHRMTWTSVTFCWDIKKKLFCHISLPLKNYVLPITQMWDYLFHLCRHIPGLLQLADSGNPSKDYRQ